MKICVYGLWHLGPVTAACLAAAGFSVTGVDLTQNTIENLQKYIAPVFEPGLDDLIREGIRNGRLNFTSDPAVALAEADLLWVTFDTPVDDQDRADVEFIAQNLISVMGFLKEGAAVVISSQVPVGFSRRMEKTYVNLYPGRRIVFAYSPENLRLGKAIHVFRNPDRIVIGISKPEDRSLLEPVFLAISSRLEWMRTESAEMTKHAINSFLATSVVFANELATVCEAVGAEAEEVERGLKSEERIGPKAYLKPGAPFAGGTLARDINFLVDLGERYNQPIYLLKAVKESNDYHKGWVKRKLEKYLGNLNGCKIAVLGLTYKPGTDTLRRSPAIELCRWIFEQGGYVQAFDPKVKKIPGEFKALISLQESVEGALTGADCAVIVTEWPVFRELQPEIFNIMSRPLVIDPNGFLSKTAGQNKKIQHVVVGRGHCEFSRS